MDLDTSRDRDRNRRSERSRFSDDKERERDRSNDRGGRKTSTVYVSNIPYECTWQELKDEFRKKIGEVKFVEIFIDENNKSKGAGLVEFTDSSSVEKALKELHRIEFKGRKIIVKEDFGRERDKHGNFLDRKRDNSRERGLRRLGRNDSMSMSSRSQMDDNKIGNTWGLSPQFLESLGIYRPLTNKVFVANLDYKVDESKLREVFKLAGKIVDTEIYRDKEGNSKGCGLVEFDHPVESVQAISMFHNQQLYDRSMTVRMDAMDDNGPPRLPDGLRNIGMGLGLNGAPLKNVSQYLQSNNTISPMGGTGPGAGILGAVPNSGLNLGSALSNVVNTPALATLASLQGLAGVQNPLLSGNLNDLNIGSLMNQNSMSAFGNAGNQGGNQMSSLMGQGYTSRDSGNMYSSDQSRDYSSGNSRFDSGRTGYGGKGDNDFSSNTQGSGFFNNGTQNQRNLDAGDTILISNISPTATFKMIKDKFALCGDIRYIDSKSKDTVVVQYSNRWEAEKAVQMLDRSRIDGRTIDVRLY